jgi:biotin carboxylase
LAETVLILGCGIMQVPALTIARDMGWNVAAADGNPDAEGRELAHRFFNVDLKDTEGLIELAGRLRKDGGLDGVFTAGTDFSLSVALVAEAMGLPGHSPEAALLATDKVKMRRRFKERGVPSPPFAEVGPGDDPDTAVNDIPGPWVVKPVDSMGARGVVTIHRREDLRPALENARKFSRSGRALVESFMEGPEFSLDALVEDGKLIPCGLADRHIVYPPFFIEMGHTIPSGVPEITAEKLWEVFSRGVSALGLTRGAAKGDVKFTPTGPMIGEIAARLSGGYMSGWTYPLSSGVEPTRGGLRLAVGLPAAVPEPSKNLVCAEKALISIDGTLKRLDGREAALSISGVSEVFLRYRPGDKTGFPRNNVEKAGNVIVTGPDAREADRRALAALRCLELELDPADPATGMFLDGSGPFPPDAFDISGDRGFSGYLDRLWNDHKPRPSGGSTSSCPCIPLPPACKCTDYTGRSIMEILNILSAAGLIRVGEAPSSPELSDFWRALVRGGLPGVRWYLEQSSL